ncbi:hypothetical protein [Yersinia aleksiciae]|uniref:Uncharacterized protein n=1 Tax=Yersinia aleksiciae TaxID=263819 RepID=A0A0T9UH92_YERAE|nr:hypothetical protein [Yersinia aleksiciae]CNL41974.1 Uncharacterised protein [Yersinia aleksiciae]
MQVETKYWVHPDDWIYVGDVIEGAREATQSEIEEHIAETASPDVT